eukprot:CAMPEP_0202908442 /NCGR_PEP_ID=MMETSP1392-20130828/46018_1 /ASSEMBLY_ACC=CAM_ASM_000868 /TAXON_ID=225041 /ORGANISM="Chlamydomonas chlamydogama, Strain SAG 11-48b" /LENGTH=700 /DNA_ID=CAMNT_0049597777 /DNA_START=52 /DNA_END=2150 /DNA_ORIENTATION=+
MEPELVPVSVDSVDDSLGQASLSGRMEGQGRVVFKSGAMYEGQWQRGYMHGTGKLTFPDGLVYEGDFQDNTITGSGVYHWPNGALYEGQVLRGKRHGKGRMSFAGSETVYEGDWVQGLRQGQGTIYFNADRTGYYQGDWAGDMKEGRGTMQYANGDVYEGDWVADLKCGYGRMQWKSTRQEYKGQWDRNMPNGIGTHLWFQQVAEPTAANHALLLMFNRYHGRFLDGQRSGYGVLYFATGARYEGMWLADKKQGQGYFVFENGDTWVGAFEEDRPVLHEGETFAPASINVALHIQDLIDEEEVPAAAARGINNVLMVYNSDLRSLYDKYCKRPSLHMARDAPRPSFTLVTAQFWELMSDARLVTAATSLHHIDQLLVQARRAPPPLVAFREYAQMQLSLADDPADSHFWVGLSEEHVAGGPHNPLAELLFPAFCEALVRVAAVRYRHLPGMERRLHVLINSHLLALVSKTKATSAPPRTPFHQEMWSSEGALLALQQAEPSLRPVFEHLAARQHGSAGAAGTRHQAASRPGTSGADDSLQGVLDRVLGQAGGAGAPAGVPWADDLGASAQVYKLETSARSVVGLMRELGLLPDTMAVMAAAGALCFNYLTANLYNQTQRLRIEAEDGQPEGGAEAGGSSVMTLDEDDEREVAAWLDVPMLYPDFVEGMARVAFHAPHLGQVEGLQAKMQALLMAEGSGLL